MKTFVEVIIELVQLPPIMNLFIIDLIPAFFLFQFQIQMNVPVVLAVVVEPVLMDFLVSHVFV